MLGIAKIRARLVSRPPSRFEHLSSFRSGVRTLPQQLYRQANVKHIVEDLSYG